MKGRLSLLALFAVLSTAAVCQPKTPTPPPTSVVLVDNAQGATDCTYTLTTGGSTQTSPGHSRSGNFTVPQSLVNADSVTASCAGFQLATQAPASLLSNHVTLTLTPSAPPIMPLPTPPTRDQLAHAHACFQGLYATTKQLGTIPSFGGVETGMETDPADRQATYAAITAAGCNAIVLDVFCHYTESGVAYPNNTACSNDWTTDNWTTLTARVAEAADAHLMTVLMQGADELPFATVQQQAVSMIGAMKKYARGDLTQWAQVGPGFDSIVPIANAPPYQASNQTLVDLLLADRAALGPSGIINLELPNGWAFAGGGALSGAGWFNSPAGQAVNVYLQEFANLSPGNDAPPKIVGGTWDAEHVDFAPVTDKDATAWNQIDQIAARTLVAWKQPPDEVTSSQCPGANNVPVTGNPAFTTACVFADVSNPSIYPSHNPPDIQVFVAAEFGTYQHTHGQSTTQQVINAGKYLSSVGYTVVWAPVAPSSTSSFAHREIH